jgi:hypothetical protein
VVSPEERKQSFFEKKDQKTFGTLSLARHELRDSVAKVFCFFSSEKKALLPATWRQARQFAILPADIPEHA